MILISRSSSYVVKPLQHRTSTFWHSAAYSSFKSCRNLQNVLEQRHRLQSTSSDEDIITTGASDTSGINWKVIKSWEEYPSVDRNISQKQNNSIGSLFASYSDLTVVLSDDDNKKISQKENSMDVKDDNDGAAGIDEKSNQMKPSPVEKLLVRDRFVYLKRDDLLRLPNSFLSGNKARKLYSLNNLPLSDFPETVVSYGGPQSNAMLALAAVVNSKNILLGRKKFRFLYYTKPLPRWLRKTPSGNYLRAMSLGMETKEISTEQYRDFFGGLEGGSVSPPDSLPLLSDLASENEMGENEKKNNDALWVPQGGACGVSIEGVEKLAIEIIEFWSSVINVNSKNNIKENHHMRRKLAVVLPGGTCTTALFLQRAINELLPPLSNLIFEDENVNVDEEEVNRIFHDDIRVVVIPCVGDVDYAKRQMKSLDRDMGGDGKQNLPHILGPKPKRSTKAKDQKNTGYYYTFGRPHPHILNTFNEMNEYGIHLDLLYGAPAWTVLLQHWEDDYYESISSSSSSFSSSPISGREIMYVHSGGMEGNASQMTRYKQQNLLPPDAVIQ